MATSPARRCRTFLAALALAACAHYNHPKRDVVATEAGYRYDVVRPPSCDRDGLGLAVSISGGGTRAAAFGYGVLQELETLRLPTGDSLLDEIDVASAVSGGSFLAAYFAAFGAEGLSRFELEVLDRDLERALLLRCLLPWNLVRLPSPAFNRTDVAARFFSRRLYRNTTYDLLASRPPCSGPFLVVNASDVRSGHRFEFTQHQFDRLGSDLGPVPLGVAVAASAAFPGLLAPLRMEKYESPACETLTPIRLALLQQRDLRRREHARRACSLSGPSRFHFHLIDGGVTDNLGGRSIADALLLESSDWSWTTRLNAAAPGGYRDVVVLIVNARPVVPARRGGLSAPSVLTVLRRAAGIPMSTYTFETAEVLREVNFLVAVLARVAGPDFIPAKVHVVEVTLEGIAADQPEAAGAGTRLALPPRTVETLIAAGRQSLRTNPRWQDVVSALGLVRVAGDADADRGAGRESVAPD